MPLDENLEIWDVGIENRRAEAASLDLFSCVEFALWDARDDATNFQRNFNIGEVEVAGGVIYHKTEYRERRNHFAFLACSEHRPGLTPSARPFWDPTGVGRIPRSLKVVNRTARIAHGWRPSAPSTSTWTGPRGNPPGHFPAGLSRKPREGKFDPPGANTSTSALSSRSSSAYLDQPRWTRLLRNWAITGMICWIFTACNTPDPHTNRMVNIWNAYQCMVTFNLSRSASYFEIGHRARDGFPRFQPGSAGFCAHDSRTCPRTHPGPGCHAAGERRRLPPIPAADQTRQ